MENLLKSMQDKFFANMKDLYTVCGGSLLMTIAGSGIEVEPYMSVLDYEKANDFDEKYLPHQTSFTVSGSDGDTGGRPCAPAALQSILLTSNSIDGTAELFFVNEYKAYWSPD
jgi:hypothetical protein